MVELVVTLEQASAMLRMCRPTLMKCLADPEDPLTKISTPGGRRVYVSLPSIAYVLMPWLPVEESTRLLERRLDEACDNGRRLSRSTNAEADRAHLRVSCQGPTSKTESRKREGRETGRRKHRQTRKRHSTSQRRSAGGGASRKGFDILERFDERVDAAIAAEQRAEEH